jgi:hypothetical protein
MLKNVKLKLKSFTLSTSIKQRFDAREIIRVKAWGENITTTN